MRMPLREPKIKYMGEDGSKFDQGSVVQSDDQFDAVIELCKFYNTSDTGGEKKKEKKKEKKETAQHAECTAVQ